ncbi:hypothetical protein R6Z07F_011459 [Ovis aries]
MTLRPSVFRLPRKPTVTGPPRSLVPAVMERGPRGPYLRLCGPVAAWAHSRAEWCRFGPHTLERKAPGEDALEEPRRTAWRPTCKPQGAMASAVPLFEYLCPSSASLLGAPFPMPVKEEYVIAP